MSIEYDGGDSFDSGEVTSVDSSVESDSGEESSAFESSVEDSTDTAEDVVPEASAEKKMWFLPPRKNLAMKSLHLQRTLQRTKNAVKTKPSQISILHLRVKILLMRRKTIIPDPPIGVQECEMRCGMAQKMTMVA